MGAVFHWPGSAFHHGTAVILRGAIKRPIISDLILKKKNIYGDLILSLIIPEERSLTIDEEQDFRLAEFQIKQLQNLGDL